MKREDVCQHIERVGIMPEALAVRAAEALLEGGVSVLEITMTVPDRSPLSR